MLSRPKPDVLAPPAIDIRNVIKRYGANKVLNGVSLTVAAGEVVVLCGPSGSGKSTLLRCVNGLEQIDSGEIRIEQRNAFSGSRLSRLDPSVGMVFQSFNLFPHLTIAQNLIVAPTLVRKLSREQALDRAKACWRASAFPRRSTPTRTCSRAVSSSVWPSRGRFAWNRRSCCSTSRLLRWIPK